MKISEYKVGDFLIDKEELNYKHILKINEIFYTRRNFLYHCEFYFSDEVGLVLWLEHKDIKKYYVKVNVKDKNLKILYD
jgi:hypothetical protein